MKAIPTYYNGVSFRSRLEARWAAFFDLAGWRWKYEPNELDFYIPDFVIIGRRPLLVEVKPDSTHRGLARYRDKVDQSGWQGESLIVGDLPIAEFPVGLYASPGLMRESLIDDDGNDLGHGWDSAEFMDCPHCGLLSVTHSSGWYGCRLCDGVDGRPVRDELRIERLWREAGNRTQWRPKRAA